VEKDCLGLEGKMEEEYRNKLNNRLTPVHLYRLTPKTNCGECGHPACLAFATQAVVGQCDIDDCPYLNKEAMGPFREQLAEQHRLGIGVKRESYEKALHFLRSEVQKWNFFSIAESLGAKLLEINGRQELSLIYFGRDVIVTWDDVAGASGEELNPWEKILLYNYVIGGATEPSGVWVGMESLPNSVSKIKSLKAHCEDRLAQAFAGRVRTLPALIGGLGRELSLVDEKVDFAAEIQVLPKLSIRVLWWEEDASEGFAAKTKFVFDSRVLQTLDLESLIFACEQLTDRLLDRVGGQ
jgi:hypothetical protein